MVTDMQKKTAHAIVNVFETGRIHGDYGQVTLLRGDSGHLTYGRSQTTLASGNLFLLIKAYCETDAAALASDLAAFLTRLEARDLSLDHDNTLRRLLREAGDDPVMHEVQDGFFDRVYWRPALASAAQIGVETPLGTAVVYDSRIHGSWKRMRDRTNERHGRLQDIQEHAWIACYTDTRRDWLANHSMTILHKTVYRMDNFKALIAADKWALPLPLTVHGEQITEERLTADPAIRVSADITEERLLRLREPFMTGEDVRELQHALAVLGIPVDPDGVFGPGTNTAIIQFQDANGLSADGIVGPATRAALGL